MAKRVRGSSTRPGQRAPLQRRSTSTATPVAATAPRPATLTADEERRAAELEAQIVAEEKSAEAARSRGGRRPTSAETGAAASSSLAVRAADEYAYVGRDVRRIVLIGGSLILFLIILSIVSHLSGAGPI
jgi:hypothetical protein